MAADAAAAPGAPPAWCWPVLAAAVLAVSTAGVAFKSLGPVPPLTLAGWRLQLTSVLLMALAAAQWPGMPREHRRRFWGDLHLSALSGASLAVHFGSWVFSLQHTSLAHSLLLVSTTPVLYVALALARRERVAWGEGLGALLALAGCAVLAAGAAAGHEREVTLVGDAAAMLAALAIMAHWSVSKRLREYQGVFIYSAPVTLLAAAALTLAGAAEARFRVPALDAGAGAFGWASHWRSAALVAYLAVVPGIIGHQGFNAVLKHLEPLTVSLAVQLEPVLGALIGYLAGVAAAPGVATWIGGALVLVATAWAAVATAQRQAQQAREEEQRRLAKRRSVQLTSSGGGAVDADDDEEAPLAAASTTAAAAAAADGGGERAAAGEGDQEDDDERQQLVVRLKAGAELPGDGGGELHARHHHHHHQEQAALFVLEQQGEK